MFYENSKLTISVSDEQQLYIQSYLIKKGLTHTEAETLSKLHKSVRVAIKNCSLTTLSTAISLKSNPLYEDLKKKFPKPNLLRKSSSNPHSNLSLSNLFSLYQNLSKASCKSQSHEKDSISNPDLAFISDLATKYNLSPEQSKIISSSGLSENDAVDQINRLVKSKPEFKNQFSKLLKPAYGEKSLFHKGMDLTCRDCTICCEEFVLGDLIFNLFCFHTFHAVCLEKWFKMSSGSKCPACGQTQDDMKQILG